MTRTCTAKEIDGPPRPLPPNSCFGDYTNLPSPDVARHLPAELLASVFICIAHDSYIDSTPTGPSWVNVSYVCCYWRDVALNCPTLWSYIPATSQRWTQELLARSQMAPLKISPKVATIQDDFQLKPARVLSIVEQVMNHSQRIQKFCFDVDVVGRETGHQVLSKFLFTHLPCLQYLDISHFNLPEGKTSLFGENVPALHTLKLSFGSMPWRALGPSVLTTLHLSDVGISSHENTMADFLSMLRHMPHLAQLSVKRSLSSARKFLSNGESDAIPMISLPYLSNISTTIIPLSAATALLSRIDIPLTAKIQLGVLLESPLEYTSTLDECVRLASLLAQRITQFDAPRFRSLTIGKLRRIALAFSTSERAECFPTSLFPIRFDVDALLKVIFVPIGSSMDNRHLCVICSTFPLINIQSIHFLVPPLSLEFWRDMLASLPNLRHIRFSRKMPNITSMLSLSSHHLIKSWQDDGADRGQGEIFVPALEEVELYQASLKRVCGTSDPNPHIADLQELYDAIATRKETRCRLTIEGCHLASPDGEGIEYLDSVGWWEGDQFRVTHVSCL